MCPSRLMMAPSASILLDDEGILADCFNSKCNIRCAVLHFCASAVIACCEMLDL